MDQVTRFSHPFQAYTTDNAVSNLFEAIRFFGVIRFAAAYPILDLILKVLLKVMPSLTAKRNAHFLFTKEKIENRLQKKTDRKDFLSYVNLLRNACTGILLNNLSRSSAATMNVA